MAKIDPGVVELHRITERYKTIRMLGLALLGTISLCAICWAAVRIADKPWWEVLIGTLGSTIVAILAGQYGFFSYLIARVKTYTKRFQGRIITLEQARDPDRQSSGLLADGSSPPEDS